MAEYYLDMETTGLNPERDKIITIQFQRLDSRTGRPLGELRILKEWESSEREIFEQFMEIFNLKSRWDFVPVGMNLLFDLNFIREKAMQYLNVDLDASMFYQNKPYLDIKPILVILNLGNFAGAALDKFTGKKHGGELIPQWYYDKEYDKIVNYVREEAQEFVQFYQKIKLLPLFYNLKKLRKE